MSTATPTVSVIVPTYDDDRHLRQAVSSVLSQAGTGADIEVVLVASGSSDLPGELADRDDRVRYLWTEPDGVAAARNVGIEAATGDVIGFCDADDYWLSMKLSRQLPRIHKGAAFVYSDEWLRDDGSLYRLESLPITDPEAHHIAHFRQGGIGSRSVLIRAELLEDKPFDERFVVREDPHLWTRLLRRTDAISRVPEPLSVKRRRSKSLTSDPKLIYRMRRLEIEDLCERFPELRPFRGERLRRARRAYAKHWLEEHPPFGRHVLHGAQRTLWTIRKLRQAATRTRGGDVE